MAFKIILSDLDGTLLRSDKTISSFSADVLAECRRRGFLIGFSTSRGRANIVSYEAQIKPDILICNGGASLVCGGKLVRSCTFSIEETRRILSAAYEVCGAEAEITLDTLEEIFWNRKHDKSTDYAWDCAYDDFKDFSQPAMKVCVQTQNREKALRIAKAVPDCDMLPFSDIPWYKFSSAKATKENAVSFLCSHLSVSADEVIAFGDDHNDIGMLRMCGTGVAMENAIPEVKAAANAVTCSNDEDGVALFLQEHILKKQ